jgi:nonribosomal peptide synthetase protein BlmVIII
MPTDPPGPGAAGPGAAGPGAAGPAVGQRIAVVGMAGRFPGAGDTRSFWQNLRTGTVSIARFPAAEANDPRFVGAEGVLDDIELFDAGFFGYSPSTAAIMDPQHRIGLQVAWHTLEDASCAPCRYPGTIGAFVGTALSSYLIRNLLPDRDLVHRTGGFSLLIHNDKDYAATTIAHKLGLSGPAMAIGTACSSSLVAVHLACQSLHAHECDMALAGGISVQVPQRQGYIYDGAGIYSPDGHCRPFDAAAAGTVGGSGAAMVALKRLDDAVADGDRIHAVILGTAVNNDGGSSAGYTAPSADGQLAVIAEAHAIAGVPADSIGLVEAHGTGTALGDAVEIDALTQAFRLSSDRTRFCAIGSVKANVGHLDTAAGVASLIKAALAVRHGIIPPHPTFGTPSTHVDWDSTPFYVNRTEQAWTASSGPRRAGVSSFGIGGTNAHVVIEQPPSPARPPRSMPRLAGGHDWHLLPLSAADPDALTAHAAALADRLCGGPADELAAVSRTLAARHRFGYRHAVVARDGDDAAAGLAALAAGRLTGCAREDRPVVFMFPGQGAEFPQMAAELFTAEPAFRRPAEECADLLAGEGIDLRAILTTGPDPADGTLPGQVSLFACEYAIARALQGWGLEPAALIGHSLGEYTAATLAGVLPLADALRLIAGRSRLLDGLEPGGMLAVSMPERELLPILPAVVTLAAVNGPDSCVAAGPPGQLEVLAAALAGAGVPARRVRVDRPFHSCLVDPAVPAFAELAATVSPRAARSGWVSTVTGDWVAADQRPGPEHWVAHMREAVRFEPGLRLLMAAYPDAVFLEVGPSTVLSSLVRRHPALGSGQLVIPAQGHRSDRGSPRRALLAAAGQVWAAGGSLDPGATAAGPDPLAADCPLYPFRRDRHWVDPPPGPGPAQPGQLDGLTAAARQCLARLSAEAPVRGIGSYPGLQAGLDQLCASLALRYLGSAGASTAPGTVHERGQLLDGLGVLPCYARFADYLLAMLSDDGIVDLADGLFTFTGSHRLADAATIAAGIKAAHPGFAGLVDLLMHAAAHYREALSTPGAALQVLYPDGKGDLLRQLLGTKTADFSVTPHLLKAVRALIPAVAGAAAGRRLRVLEIGAGSGRLSWELAEVLAQQRAEYVVTDISMLFVRQLRDEAAARGADIATRQLDISRDPAGQGFAGQRFDMIVGLDVVHATPDIPAALRHLGGLLASGGTLALVETVAQDRWLSMVWGLSAEWWSFTDQRAGTPIMSAAGWAGVMAGAPYAASAVIPGGSSDCEPDAVLILAQAPGAGRRDGHDALAPLAALPGKQPDLADWCHLPGWRHSAPVLPRAAAGAGNVSCLVLADGGSWAGLIADRLRRSGLRPVIVCPGARTEICGAEPAGTLAGGGTEDYESLLDELAGRGLAPRYVLHLWNTGPTAGGGLDQLAQSQDRGLFSLLRLVRAIAGRSAGRPVRLLAVTSCAQEVLGGELTAPERSTVHAAAKVISVEYPDLCCSSLDVPVVGSATADAAWLADRLVDELLSEPAEPVAAYRGKNRWVPSYTRWRLLPRADAVQPRAGGSYLICGGLGGIGLSLARFLGSLPAKLALVQRTPFPAREEWAGRLESDPHGDAAAAAIPILREVESRGGEVMVLQADIAELDQMRAAVRAATQQFGPLSGVIHAAGVRDMAGIIGRRSDEATWEAMAAKVRGPLVLQEALGDQRPDFILYCSSISTILHKLKFGEVGYVAGNEFLNAWAASQAARGYPGVISVAWTDWLEAGMWKQAQEELAQRYLSAAPGTFDPARDLLRGLTTAEAAEVFRRIVARPPGSQVVISGQSLDALLTRHAGFSHSDHVDVLEAIMRPGPGARGRRGLQAPYQAPRTALEQAAADVWASVLGIADIGMHDDFFDLGGDSLIALRLLARLRDGAGIHRTITDLFRAPTLAGLLSAPAATGDDGALVGPQEEVVIL